jgi:hypothetical protein
LRKNKITNRSRWFRETVLNHIFKNMDQDYPTLFSENEMSGKEIVIIGEKSTLTESNLHVSENDTGE